MSRHCHNDHHESNNDIRMICECREVGGAGDFPERPDWHRDRNCCSRCGFRRCRCHRNRCRHNCCHRNRCHRNRWRRFEGFFREIY